ncbi:MAG: sulfotransferase [Chloroflexota bacterium]
MLRLMQNLPLRTTAWLYNARRVARLLMPMSSYPLADSSNSLSCDPLIIVSAGRSGTTLLRSMLVMGNDLAMPPENDKLPLMMMHYASMQEIGWSNLSRTVLSHMEVSTFYDMWQLDFNAMYAQARALPDEQKSLGRLIDLIYLRYADVHFPNATVWGDQTPDNMLYFHWFMKVFPKAKYLHVLRDGRDVVSSLLKMPAFEVDTSVERWNQAMQRAIKIKQSLPASQFAEMRYEDLVSNPEQTLQRVCDFAGIPYKPVMLDFWKSDTTVEHQWYEHHQNLAKPLSTKSVGRWRERLTNEQQQIVNTELREMLDYYGYA